MKKVRIKEKIGWISTVIIILNFFVARAVFAQIGVSCEDDAGCTQQGFTCNLSTHACEQISSQPEPAPTEGMTVATSCCIKAGNVCENVPANTSPETLIEKECLDFKTSDCSSVSECSTNQGSGGTNSSGVIGCREGQDCVSLINPLATATNQNPKIPTIIGKLIQVVMGIVGSLTLVVFLYGGFLWLTSAGNSEKIAKGLQAMLWAGIGIIVVFSSYAILTLILNTLQAAP